jgi:hypothetical protein
MHYEREIQAARMRSLIALISFFKIELMDWFKLTARYSFEFQVDWQQMTILTDVMQLSSLQWPARKPTDPQTLVQIFEYK